MVNVNGDFRLSQAKVEEGRGLLIVGRRLPQCGGLRRRASVSTVGDLVVGGLRGPHVDLGQANGRDGLLRLGFGNFQFKRADGIEFGEFFVVLEGFVFGLMLGQSPR